jgi:hypothetical protein
MKPEERVPFYAGVIVGNVSMAIAWALWTWLS